MDTSTHTLLETGSWGSDITWELYATSTLPPIELCSAVMCVAITEQKVVLARSARGWSMLGGHVEDDETLEETLHREAREEGGFVIAAHTLFTVRRITSRQPISHPQPGKMYPHPVSYIPYYWATTTQRLEQPTGEEIIESGSFGIADLHTLHTPDQPTIEAGWNAYRLTTQ